MTALLEPGPPAFRVVTGSPTDEEVAALAVVLAAFARTAPSAAAPDPGPAVARRPWRRRRTWCLPREETVAPARPVRRTSAPAARARAG